MRKRTTSQQPSSKDQVMTYKVSTFNIFYSRDLQSVGYATTYPNMFFLHRNKNNDLLLQPSLIHPPMSHRASYGNIYCVFSCMDKYCLCPLKATTMAGRYHLGVFITLGPCHSLLKRMHWRPNLFQEKLGLKILHCIYV